MITMQDVYKVYENGAIAVSNVSFTLQDTSMVAIVGHSGAGKSTLLNLLSNNDTPSTGEIFYDGKAYKDIEKDFINKQFAYVYQDFKLIENLTVYQNILLANELANKDIDNDFILRTAEVLGLTALLDEKVYALSGGQKQRVAIARAVSSKANVIVADEPTGNLDGENSQIVFETLKKLSEEILVIVVSHDKRIIKFADRLIRLKNGKITDDYMLNNGNEDITQNVEESNEFQQCSQFNDEKNIQDEREINEDELDESNQNFVIDSVVEHVENINLENAEKKNETAENKLNLACAEIENNKAEKAKKTSKIDIKNIFSYTKGVNKTRKKEGLSFKSICSLTLAFANKNIGKKVTLTVVSLIMIMLICLTSAVLFSSTEYSFCKNMKINKAPFITYSTSGKEYRLDKKEYDKLSGYIKDNFGVESYVVAKTYLNDYLNDIMPADDVVAPTYAKHMNLNSTKTIYIDEPSKLNLQFIVGVPPKANENYEEIAISKTWYNYFCEVKRFDNGNGQIVDFEKTQLIGEFIEPFNFAITGVFEDYNNDYDMNTEDEKWNLYAYNDLAFTILRPQSAIKYNNTFSINYLSPYRLVFEDMQRQTFSIAPNSKEFFSYYYREHQFTQFAENEILMDKDDAEYYYRQSGKQIQVGSQVKLKFIKQRSGVSGGLYLADYGTKTFVVKDIVDNLHSIVVNETLFNDWVAGVVPAFETLAISSKSVKPKMLKDIRNFAYYGISSEISNLIKDDFYKENFYLDFDMIKYNGNNEFNNAIILVSRICIALPLFILSVMLFGIVLSVMISDMIKTKSNEILILKTLGAKNTDVWKIFGFVVAILFVFQVLCGILLGVGLVAGLNAFWMIIEGFSFYNPTFFVTASSVCIVLLATLAISAFGLWFNVKKLNEENLRCAFQKQKQ